MNVSNMTKAEDKQGLCSNDAEAGAAGSSPMQSSSSSSYPRQQPPMLPQAPPQYQQQQATDGLQVPSSGAPREVGAPPPPPLPPQQRPRVLPYDTNQVTVVPYIPSSSSPERPKSLSLAIVLCVSVLGIFGAHHFYLNRPVMGILYINTLGMLGIGWIIDWFRICSLVSSRNEEDAEVKERGYWLTGVKYGKLNKRSLVDAYLMWFPPVGWYGFHQFYVGRTRYGMFCACTLGLNLIGWLVDFFRMPYLVHKANQEIEKMRRGETVEEKSPYNLLDAYLLAFPLGLFGVHHFYLGNTRRGIFYLCTLGVFGLGWLADMFQMPLLVSEANRNREFKERLFSVLDNQPAQQIPTTLTVDGTNVVVIPSSDAATAPAYHGNQYQHPQHQYQGPISEPPPAYMPHASAGEIVESSYQQQSIQYPSS